MLGCFCLAELDLRSNPLNKIQFTFEGVPCLILGLVRRFFHRCASILTGQAGYTQLAHSTGANVSVMVLQGCKSTSQKSRPIESGHGRHAAMVQVANVCSYKLG